MKRINVLLLLVFGFAFNFAISQNQYVSGTVTNEKGKTMPGVSVMEEGTKNGTITDIDGRFNLRLSKSKASKPILTFQFIGYPVKRIEYIGQVVINVQLEKGKNIFSQVTNNISNEYFRLKPAEVDRIKYCDITIENETSFILFDKDLSFQNIAYSVYDKLFIVSGSSIYIAKVEDLVKGYSDFKRFDLNFQVDNRRNSFCINTGGDKIAIMDKENNIHVFDVFVFEEISKIEIPEKYHNNGTGIPFSFISDDEILISGYKYAAVLNTKNGKVVEKYKFDKKQLYESTEVTPNRFINRKWGYRAKDDEIKVDYQFKYHHNWNFFWKENTRDNTYTFYQKFLDITSISENKLIEYFYENYVFYDPFKRGFLKLQDYKLEFKPFDKNRSIYIDHYDNAEWVSNYRYIVGIKEGNSGIAIFDYINLPNELDKQVFLQAWSKNSASALVQYIEKENPKQIYLDKIFPKLDSIYLAQYNKIPYSNQKTLDRSKQLKTYLIIWADDKYEKGNKTIYFNKNRDLVINELQEIYSHLQQKAIASNNIKIMESFLTNFPLIGEYPRDFSNKERAVKDKIKALYRDEYEKVVGINTVEAYQSYANSYPKSPYIKDANSAVLVINTAIKEEKEQYEKAMQSNNIAMLNQYIKNYPQGEYIAVVKNKKQEFEERRQLIEKGKNTNLWKMGNKVCLIQYQEIVALCGTLDAWNEDKSMAKINLVSGMWDKQNVTYNGESLFKGKSLWIEPKHGWHLCLDEELNLINENTNMPNSNGTSSGIASKSKNLGTRCYWTETLVLSNDDGSLIGSLFSSLTDIKFLIKYDGVIEEELGDNYKIIISDARVDLGRRASVNQIKYKDYANEKVKKNIGQIRVLSKSNVNLK